MTPVQDSLKIKVMFYSLKGVYGIQSCVLIHYFMNKFSITIGFLEQIFKIKKVKTSDNPAHSCNHILIQFIV